VSKTDRLLFALPYINAINKHMTKRIFNIHEISKEKPCKRCGGTEKIPITRYYSSGKKIGEPYKTTRCKTCASKYGKKYRDNNKEYHLEWQRENREHLRAYQREYYKDKYGERNAKHEKRLKERYVYNDMDDIQEFYRNCPKGFHVDHIIPLNGKNVSGLHTISNLQYLLASENQRKYNKFNIE
jgi:hypothetical protein